MTPELGDAARKQLDSRRSADAPTRHTHKFPLRGKIICPKCKRPLSGYMITKTLGPQAKLVLCYYGILLLAIYGVGHCAVIVLAGTFTEVVQHYLNWNE